MYSSHQQPALRLTKKQKKATAFRERGGVKSKGNKGKGKGPMIGKPEPYTRTHTHTHSPTHSRPSLATTGDNGEDGYYDCDEDSNAIPAMEDQDQALAAMAGYTEEDSKGDNDSAQKNRRRAVLLQKKTAMESTSSAAQGKKKRKRGSSGIRAEESEEAPQPGPKKKKAKLAGSSEEAVPAREEDGTMTSMNDGEDGSETKSKETKPSRYILFIGNVSATPTPLT
jgi:hypothetical protein